MVGRGPSAIRRSHEKSSSDRFPYPPWSHPPVIGGVALPTSGGPSGVGHRPPGYGPREGSSRRWVTIADDNIDKSSAPRGGGSVGRGALTLLLRGSTSTYRRPQTLNNI